MKKIINYLLIFLACLALYAPVSKASSQVFQITTLSLPAVQPATSYSTKIYFSYSGGGEPSAKMTGLPQNFNLNPLVGSASGNSYWVTLYGLVQGIQMAPSYPVILILSDNFGNTLSQNYTLTIGSPPNPQGTVFNVITTQWIQAGASSPEGSGSQTPVTVGGAYSANVQFTSNNTYSPTASFMGLPPGINAQPPVAISYANSASGTLTTYSIQLNGSATKAGTYNPVLYITDQTNSSATQQFIVLVVQSPQLDVTNESSTSTTTSSSTTTASLSNTPSQPDSAGSNVSASGTVYMITIDGQRRPYTSAGAFLSYGFNTWANVIPASSADLALPTGSFIPPRNGKIICSNKGSDKGTCYLITDSKKAAFTSAAVFTGLGFSFSNSLSGDVSFMPSAPNINSSSQAHPAGTLINKNGTIYLVGDSGLLGIPDMATLTSWGYSLTDSVPANVADSVSAQSGVMAVHTAGALSPFGN